MKAPYWLDVVEPHEWVYERVGAVRRGVAFLMDFAVLAVVLRMSRPAAEVEAGASLVWVLGLLLLWGLLGSSLGKGRLGLCLMTTAGKQLHGLTGVLRAAVRMVVFLCFPLWVVSLPMLVLRADGRTLHDLAAGTQVVHRFRIRGRLRAPAAPDEVETWLRYRPRRIEAARVTDP